jgi:hypothetical protein
MNEFDDDFNEAEQNPFVTFLRNCLSKINTFTELAESVRWVPGLWPSYRICTEEAASVVGNDTTAAHAILCGAAALHEMPKGSSEERADWARAELDRKYDSPDLNCLFYGPAGPHSADAQASNSGDASS